MNLARPGHVGHEELRPLEIRWPRLVEVLPGSAVGSLGAFWTIQRLLILAGALR